MTFFVRRGNKPGKSGASVTMASVPARALGYHGAGASVRTAGSRTRPDLLGKPSEGVSAVNTESPVSTASALASAMVAMMANSKYGPAPACTSCGSQNASYHEPGCPGRPDPDYRSLRKALGCA